MTSPDGQVRLNQKVSRKFQSDRPKYLLCVCVLLAPLTLASAGSNLNPGCPLGFFTNVASRLLSAQFDLDLTRIQVYPTNQYTPAVHRLLQIVANVYEATSTNSYPTVFRPLFSRDAGGLGTNVFISGFTNVASVTGPDDSQLALPIEAAGLAETNIPVINLPVNVYGVPWIIGARKGLPNFNEFAVESVFQFFRKLQVTRPSTNAPISDYKYSQMFLLSLTNQLGVECWNSYTNDFTDPVAIYVTDNQTVTLTNDEGFSTSIPTMVSASLQIPNGTTGTWPGYNPAVNPLLAPVSFQIPLDASVALVPPSIYRFNEGDLPYLTTNLTLPYESNVVINGTGYPQPHWWLTTTNDVRVIIMDTAVNPYHIIDYVQLSGPDSSRDLTSEIISEYDTATGPSGNDLWDTNFLNGIPIGFLSQIGVSLSQYTPAPSSSSWDTSSTVVQDEIDGFRAFFHLAPPYNNIGAQQIIAEAEMTNAMQAPYTPIATVVQHISWQANDPLVHYLASDLNWAGASRLDRTTDNLTNENLGRLNQHYMPWGGNPMIPLLDQNPYNLELKDPLVWSSDNWDFPDGQPLDPNWAGQVHRQRRSARRHFVPLNPSWVGQVHRGTPWQTIYLKSQNVLQGVQIIDDVTNYNGTNVWMAWTGDTNMSDAIAMAPVQDWHVASLLAHIMNTRSLQSRFSVNDPKINAWLRLLLGRTALTNNLSDSQLASGAMPQFETLVIRHHSPQAHLIADAIESAKASQPGGFFHDVGDILEVPELSDQSPFLNWNDVTQQENGISDEAYEVIPSQLLPLLRADSVGSVGLMNGQIVAQFTGYDDHIYAVEVSSNLVNWTSVSTNLCQSGKFNFTNSAPADATARFYQSILVQ